MRSCRRTRPRRSRSHSLTTALPLEKAGSVKREAHADAFGAAGLRSLERHPRRGAVRRAGRVHERLQAHVRLAVAGPCAQILPGDAVRADERARHGGPRREQPGGVLHRDRRERARRPQADGDDEVGAGRHRDRRRERHRMVAADGEGARSGDGRGGKLGDRRRDAHLVARARLRGIEARGGDAAVAAARVPRGEPAGPALEADALGPAKSVVLVDGVVVGGALDAVEHRHLGAQLAVVVGDPEVPALPPRRAPAVLDQEGAGAGWAPQEPPGRIRVVPADDTDVVVEFGVARVVGAGREVVVRSVRRPWPRPRRRSASRPT